MVRLKIQQIGPILISVPGSRQFGGLASNCEIVSHSVPQVSILGPLLLIIFINDMPLYVKSERVHVGIDLYADNTSYSTDQLHGTINRLQESMYSALKELEDGGKLK